MAEMRAEIESAPGSVWVSVHKLWPASTILEDWVWAHGRMDGNRPVLSQARTVAAEWFALGFTYTPAQLLDLAVPHMPAWVFGQIDNGLAAVARQHNIYAWAAEACMPKHLHFYPREDDASWRPGHVQSPTRPA